MSRIKVLPEDVARQIAAGEVVERPAAVIKELLENALDAGATCVHVRAEGGGATLLEVRDDGAGIERDDLALATTSFATSKIENADDLFNVATYGFRGEALASISAVSLLDIRSSTQDNGEGWRYALEGKRMVAEEPVAHERGTTVRVENLFFNTPARKKFLKAETTERRRILGTVLAFAIAHPAIEVHYADDSRTPLDLPATDDWRSRVAAILGAGNMKHLVDIDARSETVAVRGFTSLPTYTRANRSQQFVFINGRLVKEHTVAQAVVQAYKAVIPYRRFPAVILSIDVPPELVDVNVHPTKMEVRLRHSRHVFEVVYRAIKSGLSGSSEASLDVSYTTLGEDRRGENQRGEDTSGDAKRGTTLSALPGGAPQGANTAKSAHAPELSLVPPVRESSGSYESRVKGAVDGYLKGAAKALNPQLSLRENEKTSDEQEEEAKEIHAKLRQDEALFWQFNNSYIFIQVRDGLVVIDQHAAHERIIFDDCRDKLEREIPISQQILFPVHMELTIEDLAVFRESKDLFHKLGFHLEPFGGTSILVRGLPHGVKNWNEGQLLRNIFDDVREGNVPGNTHVERIVASFACQSAVKAGQKLSMAEMKMLADQLFARPNPYSCPHGRPTVRRLSLDEVAGWFGRH